MRVAESARGERKPRRATAALRTIVLALALVVGASAIGLAVNAARRDRIPLVAPFPYEQDCPDKQGPEVAATVTVAQARALVGRKDVVLLDARPAEEFADGHIVGARSFPYSFVTPPGAAQARALRGYSHVVIYCDSPGDRLAQLLADQLRGLGLATTRVLEGGLAAWGKR
jgi:rhodanese-related sulfurtransferase